MKRITPFILSIVFLVCALPTFVFAETTGSTGTSTTTSTTGSTAPSVEPEFDFEYSYAFENIIITWNADETGDLFVKSVKIGDKAMIVDDSTGFISFDIRVLKPGRYSISLEMSDGRSITSERKVERGGELKVNLKLTRNNNLLTAFVIDNNQNPISDIEVIYKIGNQDFEKVITDANGYASFTNKLPADISDVHCVVEDQVIPLESGQEIRYTGTDAWLNGGPQNTTTSASKTNTTSSSAKTTQSRTNTTVTEGKTTPATTKSTLPIVTGAGTTAIVGDKVAVNVSFDSGVQKSFDYSAKDFAARSRLLLSKSVYAETIGDTSSSLMLLVQTSSFDITDQHISSAISGKSKYSLFHTEDTLRIPLNLSMQIINNSLNINTSVNIPGTEVTIELPVPKAMKKTSKYTVTAAAFDDDGIVQLFDTTVKDGIMTFKTNNLSSVVILGFANPAGIRSGGGIPYFAVGLIIFGILLLGGAGTLLYFFFLRKTVAEFAVESGSDYAGDMEMTENLSDVTEASSDNTPVNKGVSLGSLLNKPENDEN